MSGENFNKLMECLGPWSASLDTYPGWKEWRREKISHAMWFAEGLDSPRDPAPGYFPFSQELALQHDAIMSFLNLAACLHSLQQCEFYFRRYPFRGLPVSHHDHFRNSCEMYFNRFYEFKARLKTCLNAVNKSVGAKLDVGALLKQYEREFDQELRARNSVNHHEPFDDLAVEAIGMATLIGYVGNVELGWQAVARSRYRRSTAEWASRVKRRSKAVETFVEATAGAMLANCAFLKSDNPTKNNLFSTEISGNTLPD